MRWTAQPVWYETLGTSSQTRGYSSSCADGWVSIGITPGLQSASAGHWSSLSLVLKAVNEADHDGWKRFDSTEGVHDPYVTITYNSAPGVPSNLSVAPCYTSCGAGAATAAVRPTLSATVTDANPGDSIRAEFEVWNTAHSTLLSSSGLTAGVSTGATVTWQVGTDLVNGTSYDWRVRAYDGHSYSAWSAWTAMTIDTTAPGVPFVSATIYLNDGQPHGGAGVSDQFTFTPAAGTTDLGAFVYQLDTSASSTTVAATGATTVTITPPSDGHRTLTVWAKDRAGNLSGPNVYAFQVGSAALAQPLPGANVIKRSKLAVDSVVPQYTRAYFEYRRGPGGTVLAVPSANLTSATGAAITATPATPVDLSSLGGYAIWNATDTLGSVGGVVEVRAQLYTATSPTPVYATAWVRVTVDPNGDGSADTSVGPGSVNLLTGDYSLSSTDADELGLSAGRAASSRAATDGLLVMGERLTANQQQVSTDLTGFTVPTTSSAARVTTMGQGDATPTASLEITPTSTDDTYVAVGGDGGGLRLNMAGGKTYRMTGWIYVPPATGLVPSFPTRGLRIVAFYRDSAGNYHEYASAKANYTDAWQELSVDLPVAAGATEAFFRLYDGMPGGTGKKVFWDHLSMAEVVAPFGPSWKGGGAGGASVDYTTLTFPELSLARVNLVGGGWVTFSKNADGVSFTPEPGSEGLVLSNVDASTYRLSELDGTVSELTQQGAVWAVSSTWTSESNSTTRYVYDTANSRALLKKVINPVEPGVDDTNHCTTATPARGCEVMEYVYATSTTPGLSQTVFGDVTDQVSTVKIWSWNPAAGTESAVDVARYAYDNLGQLREVWDPRVSPALKTAYEYGPGGRVTKVTPPGQLPWMVDYGAPDVDTALLRWNFDEGGGGTVADASGNGRTGTFGGTGTGWGQGNDPGYVGDGAATLTATAGQQVAGPNAVVNTSQSFTVSAWVNLTDTSSNRTAVSQDGNRYSGFFLNYVSSLNRWVFSRMTSDTEVRATSDAAPTLGAWTHLVGVHDTAAGTMRLYVNGVLQSTTAPAGNWSATGAFVVGRAKGGGTVVNTWAGGIDDVRVYQKVLSDDQIAALAGDENPGRLLRVRRTTLLQGSPTTTDGEIATNIVYHVPLTTGAGGPYNLNYATVIGRPHTVEVYDEGKPDGATYHLLTTETEGAQVVGYPDADTQVTKHGYNPDNGSVSGWTLKQPTKVIADAGPGGAALTSYVVYDSAGRATASWGIDSTGADARTSKTIFYTAGANPLDAGCANQPEWAGQPCVTMVAAAPGTVDPARMTAELAKKRVSSYSRWGDAAVVTDSVAGTSASRTTTTLYDDAGRTTSVQITSTGDGATQIPAVTSDYHPASGQVTATHAGTATITREYDLWGRLYRYTDADGGVTTNEFDRYGNPTKVSDPTGNATFGYDRVAEPRGLLTSVTDSIAGTFTAAYSADGQLTTLHYPGGMTRTDILDANLEPVTRSYTRDSDSAVIYSQSIVSNSAGQTVSDSYTGGSKTYGYDRIGRLTSTRQVSPATAGCVTRTYSYDNRTNRTARKTYNPAGDGSCASTSGSPDAEDDHSYDAADRITDAGYIYDPYGRITALPGGLTNSFYANDLVAGQILGTTRQDWTLDPAHRPRAFTTASYDGSSWTTTASRLNHYGDDSDSPRWIIEDTTAGTLTRMVSGPDANLAATTTATGDVLLHIVNLHGDIAATIGGQPTPRYGWLGGKQRSGEALGGVILMGVRLYAPNLGRFLQVDPEPGGSATAYDYCNADPVNCTDLDGRWPNWKKVLGTVAKVAEIASYIPGPIGTISAVVSAGCYAATGNWAKAGEMALTAAANLVGAGAVVHAAVAAVAAVKVAKVGLGAAAFIGRGGKAIRGAVAAGRAIGRGAMAAGRAIGRGAVAAGRAIGRGAAAAGRRLFGKQGLLFGSKAFGPKKGWLNRGPLRLGWGKKHGQRVFRIGIGWPLHMQTNRFKQWVGHRHRDIWP